MSNVSSTKGSKSGKLKRLKAKPCTSSSSQESANLNRVLDSSSETNRKRLLSGDPEITFKPVQSAASSQRLQNDRQYISCSADMHADERHSPDTTSEANRCQENQSPDTTSSFHLAPCGSENPTTLSLDENCSVPDTTSKVNHCQSSSGPYTSAAGYDVCVACNRYTGNQVSSQNSLTVNQPPFRRPRGRPVTKQPVDAAHRNSPQEHCTCHNVKTEVISPQESNIKAEKNVQSTNCNSQVVTVKKRGRPKKVSLENQDKADSTPMSSKRKRISRLPAVVHETVVSEDETPSNIMKSMKKVRTHRNSLQASKRSQTSTSETNKSMFSDMSKFKITVTFDKEDSVTDGDLYSTRVVNVHDDEGQHSPGNVKASSPQKKKSGKIKLKISPKLDAKTASPVKGTSQKNIVCQTVLCSLNNRTVRESNSKERKNGHVVSPDKSISPTKSTVEEGLVVQSTSARHLLDKSETRPSYPQGDISSVVSSQSFGEESSKARKICVHQSPHAPKSIACVQKKSQKLCRKTVLSQLITDAQSVLDSPSLKSKKRAKKDRSPPSVKTPICNVTANPLNVVKSCNEPYVAIHKISSEFITNPGLLISEMATCGICSPSKSIQQKTAVSDKQDDDFISILENFNETDKLCKNILQDNAETESYDIPPSYSVEQGARDENDVVEDTVAENYLAELLNEEYYNQSKSTEPNQVKEKMIEDTFSQNEIDEVDGDCEAMVKKDARNEELSKDEGEENTVDRFAYFADAVVDLDPIVTEDSSCQSVAPLPTPEVTDDVTDEREAVADGLLDNSFDWTKMVSPDLTIEEVCDTDSDDGSVNYSQADSCNKSVENYTPAETHANENLDCYEMPDATNFTSQKPEENKCDSDAEYFKSQGIPSDFFISSLLTDNSLGDFLQSEDSEEGIFVTNRKLKEGFLVKATLSHDRNKLRTNETESSSDVICGDVPETCISNVDMKSLPEDLLNVDINFDAVDEPVSVTTDLTDILNKIKAASSGIDFSPELKIECLTKTVVDNTGCCYTTEDFCVWRRGNEVMPDSNLEESSANKCESSNENDGHPGKDENATMVNDQESFMLNDFERAISKPCVFAKKKKRREKQSGEITNGHLSNSSSKDSHKKSEMSSESSKQHSDQEGNIEENSVKDLSIDDIILEPTDSFLKKNIKRKKSPRKEVNSKIVKRILMKRASEEAIASNEVSIPEVPLSAIETFSLNTISSSSTSKLENNVSSPKMNLTKQLDIVSSKMINKSVDSLFGFPRGINFGRSFRKSDECSSNEIAPVTSIFSHDRDGLKYPPLYEPSGRLSCGSGQSESDSSINSERRKKRKWEKETKSIHQNQMGIKKLPRLPPSDNSDHSGTTSQLAKPSKIIPNSYFQSSSSRSAKPFLFGKLSESAAAMSPAGSLFGVSKKNLFGGPLRSSFTFGVKSPPMASSGNNLQSIWTTFSPIARNKDEPKANMDVGSRNLSDINFEDQRFSSESEDSGTEDDRHIDKDIPEVIKVENMELMDDIEGEELDYEYENSDDGEGMFVHSTPHLDKKEENNWALRDDLIRNDPPQSPGIHQEQLSDEDSLHDFTESPSSPTKSLDFSEPVNVGSNYESPTLNSDKDMHSPLPTSRLLSPNCDTDDMITAEFNSKQANVTPNFKTPYSETHFFSDNTTLELDVSPSNMLSDRSSDNESERHDSMFDSEDNTKWSTMSSDNESDHSMHSPSSAGDNDAGDNEDDDDFNCDVMSIYAPSIDPLLETDDEEDPPPQIPMKRVPVTSDVAKTVPATLSSTLTSLITVDVPVPSKKEIIPFKKEKVKHPSSCLFEGPPQVVNMNIKHMVSPGHCHTFLKHQHCPYGGGCRYKHTVLAMDEVFSTTVANMEKYCKCRNIQFAFEAYRCLVKYFSHKITEHIYQLLIELCANEAQTKTAFSLVKDICDHKMLNARMVDGLVQMCRVDSEVHVHNLWMLFSIFSMLNIQPSDESFPILLQCFHKREEWDYLWKVLSYCNECEFTDIPVAIVNKVLIIAVNKPLKFLTLAIKWLANNKMIVVEKAQRQLLDRFIDCCKEHKWIEMAESLSEILRQHKPSQPVANSLHEERRPRQARDDDLIEDYHLKIKGVHATQNWKYLSHVFLDLCAKPFPGNAKFINAYCDALHSGAQQPDDIVIAVEHFITMVLNSVASYEPINVDTSSLVDICFQVMNTFHNQHLWRQCYHILYTLHQKEINLYNNVDDRSNKGRDRAMVAMDVCLNIDQPLGAFEILHNTGFQAFASDQTMSVVERQNQIYILSSLLTQLCKKNEFSHAVDVFQILVFRSEKDVSACCNEILFSCLEDKEIDLACRVFDLHLDYEAQIKIGSSALRGLLIANKTNGCHDRVKQLYEFCITKGIYPRQRIEAAERIIHIRMSFVAVEVVVIIEHYLDTLYNYLCDRMLDGDTRPDTRLAIRIEADWKNNNHSQKAHMMVSGLLQSEFHPPLEGRSNRDLVILNSYLLTNFLKEKDDNGRRQGLFHDSVPPRRRARRN